MTKAKLILLTGFGASGKTTIAKRYIQDHDLAMTIEADELVNNMGNWANHTPEIRALSFELIKSMSRTYLQTGHDVILPYLVEDIREIEAFESIAHDCQAQFYEIVLYREPSKAIEQLLKRGKWGQADAAALGDKDMPDIESSISKLESALGQRPNVIKIQLDGRSPDDTYQELLEHLVAA
jgi:predicted kinase